MTAWILVGGRLVLTDALRALPRPDLVIAADGGGRHAAALGVDVDAVNLKATTGEGIGFVGRMEGVAALAVATLTDG